MGLGKGKAASRSRGSKKAAADRLNAARNAAKNLQKQAKNLSTAEAFCGDDSCDCRSLGISFHFDEVGDGAPDVIEVGSCSSSDENDGGSDCSSDDADVLLERQQQLDVMKEVLDFGKQAGGRPARYFGNSDRTKRRKHAQAKDDRAFNGNTLRSMSFFNDNESNFLCCE